MISSFLSNLTDSHRRQLGMRFAASRRTYERADLYDHLLAPGAKRILSLDGGGVRSAMTLAILDRVERVLKKRHGEHDGFRLCDYYDLIGGTSTGAFVATLLAAGGYTVEDARDTFFTIAERVYRPGQEGLRGERLERDLESLLGKMTLGNARIPTGLGILAKRVDTEETVMFHNHPDVAHSGGSHDRLPLWRALRASIGAPQRFTPQLVDLGTSGARASGLFVDSTVTSNNNPSFQLFLLATLEKHGFGWDSGAENLLITSVGTGNVLQTLDPATARRLPPKRAVQEALAVLADGADQSGELFMQLLSTAEEQLTDKNTLAALRARNTFGDPFALSDVRIEGKPQFSYQRYQARLQQETLRKTLGIALTRGQLATVRSMDNPDALHIAYEIGQAVADRVVRPEHFPTSFDLAPYASRVPEQPAAAEAGTPSTPSANQTAAGEATKTASLTPLTIERSGVISPSARRQRL